MSIILKAENISKQYRLGQVGTGTLSHDLNRWWHSIRGKEDPYLKIGSVNDRTAKEKLDYVWALHNINFEVQHGEVLGIIGKNGAGKSTLLKLLSKVTSPTTGSIRTKGRIASLLEVGTGFHPELTGRENIFMNGAILGMTKSEIRNKLSEIIEFSGCELFIDTPVKRYSSGMTVRLGFAVAAHLEPEILVVDEVLAVGDAEFQKKALGKMHELSSGQGRTVLFVSHNMSSVRNLCTKGILLENGIISNSGKIEKVLSHYLNTQANKHSWSGEDGNGTVRLIKTAIFNEKKDESFLNSDVLKIQFVFELKEDFSNLVIGASLISSLGNPIVGLLYNDYNDYNKLSKGIYEVTFLIPPYHLATGNYEVTFNISIPYVKKFTTEESNLSFSIIAKNEKGNRFLVENDFFLNSVLRPNWFQNFKKIL